MKRFISSSIACLIAIISVNIFVHTFANAAIGSTATGNGNAPIGVGVLQQVSTTSATDIATESSFSEQSLSQSHPTSNQSAYPARLSVPSLNIDAKVQDVGINAKGAIGIPTNFTDVAWYKHSTIPGMNGNAVIDGHVDNGLALAGVFKHLSNVKVGDDIYITTESGTKVHFIVKNVNSYNYKDISMETILNGSNDGAYLWLITCGGTWVPAQKTYDQRIVVGAVMQ